MDLTMSDNEIPELVYIDDEYDEEKSIESLHPRNNISNLEDFDVLVDKIIPITILTGFLGSGKTTLLSYILSVNHKKRIAVIENELSMGLGIESLIAKSGVTGKSIDGFFELNNGCICCSVKDNLLSTLEQLTKHSDRFDYIIIEMTGVANPGPVISSFWLDEGLHSALKLDGIICVVDCVNIHTYLQSEDISNDVKMQICYADRILINKCDLVESKQIHEVESIVKELNGLAEITQTSLHIKPSIDFVLDINGYATNIDTVIHRGIFKSNSNTNSNDNNSNSNNSGSFSLSGLCQPCQDDSSINNMSADNNSNKHSASVLSTQGFLLDGKLRYHEIQRYLDTILYREGYRDDNNNTNRINSDNSNSDEFDDDNKTDMRIFRIKGILCIENDENLYILQGVYDTFELTRSNISIHSLHDSMKDVNKVVVIGKNIDVKKLEKGFKSCIQA